MAEKMTFFRQGDNFLLGHDAPSQRYDTLPAATYMLRASLEQGFYLELTDDFKLPKKLYGTLELKAGRILDTFNQRAGTTGVSLTGEKGSGKTLLTKLISTKARARGIPTIVVNIPASGDAFNIFLQNIKQQVVLLFDEFEKVYDEAAQTGLLTLLDGVFNSKKLFLMTSNTYSKIDTNLQNRPGRIYYYLNFEGLDISFIMEYGSDNLNNKDYLNNLGVLAGLIKPMNFDMLQAVVEESNRYSESPMETLAMLNVRVTGQRDAFNYILTIPGKVVSKVADNDTIKVNPLEIVSLNYVAKTLKGRKDEFCGIKFSPSELVLLDGINGKYEYVKASGPTLKLSRAPLDIRGFAQIDHLL